MLGVLSFVSTQAPANRAKLRLAADRTRPDEGFGPPSSTTAKAS